MIAGVKSANLQPLLRQPRPRLLHRQLPHLQPSRNRHLSRLRLSHRLQP
jgi:hypothetical protein